MLVFKLFGALTDNHKLSEAGPPSQWGFCNYITWHHSGERPDIKIVPTILIRLHRDCFLTSRFIVGYNWCDYDKTFSLVIDYNLWSRVIIWSKGGQPRLERGFQTLIINMVIQTSTQVKYIFYTNILCRETHNSEVYPSGYI